MLQRIFSTLIVIAQVSMCHGMVAASSISHRNGLALFLGVFVLLAIVFPIQTAHTIALMYRFYMRAVSVIGYGTCLLGTILGSLALVSGSLKEDSTLRELGFELVGYSVGGAIVLWFILAIIRNVFEGPPRPTLPVREEKKIATHAAFNELDIDELQYES